MTVNRTPERRPLSPQLDLVPGHRPEPDTNHRADAPPLASPARMITLLSGKGGVGKTNIAANLAIALGQQGKRVLLVDGDLSLSSLDLLMGVMPRHTAADMVAGRATLDETVVDSYAGVRVLPSACGDDDLANLDDFRRHQFFRSLSGLTEPADLILIDGGAGVGRNVTSLARLGGQNLIVLTPEPPAISAAFALLKILDRSGLRQPPGIVVNQASGSLEARECWNRISKACSQFMTLAPEWWGWLPADPRVGRAVRAQEPFLLAEPTGPAARSIVRLAQRVLENNSFRGPEGAGRPPGARMRLAS